MFLRALGGEVLGDGEEAKASLELLAPELAIEQEPLEKSVDSVPLLAGVWVECLPPPTAKLVLLEATEDNLKLDIQDILC